MKFKLLTIPLMALALPMTCTAGMTATAKPSPSPAVADSTWSGDWDKFENEMDRIFHESMDKLHLSGNEKAQFGSSINIQENDNAYVARIYAPGSGSGNVNVTLKDGTLDISTGGQKTGAYSETVTLPGPVQQDKMKVEHKDGFVVVTIPKDKSAAMASVTPQPNATLPKPAWDHDVVREMQRMQDRMDQLTRDVFAGLPTGTMTGNGGQFLSSSVKLDDEQNQYVVHFYLPDSNISNFNVDLKDNQLQLSATQESKKQSSAAGGAGSQYSESSYEEAITIPGPVHADKMKVDRKEGVVTVTLPKA